jgi:hypothetical protein
MKYWTMNCLVDSFAYWWIRLQRKLNRLEIEDDNNMEIAKDTIQRSIEALHTEESKLNEQWKVVCQKVRNERQTMSKAQLQTQLMKSKRTRAAITSIQNKTQMLETQLHAIETNQFNQTVLDTLQMSASALKRLGQDKNLQNTDQVISELEDGMTQAHDINYTISNGINITDPHLTLDDDALAAELDEILGIDTASPVVVADTVVSMSTPVCSMTDTSLPQIAVQVPSNTSQTDHAPPKHDIKQDNTAHTTEQIQEPA